MFQTLKCSTVLEKRLLDLRHLLVPIVGAIACCCCLPTPWTLVGGGESDVPACGPPASFSFHLASSTVTTAGSVHKSRGDNVGAVEEMICVVYVSVTEGYSGDGCDLASTLCKYDLRKGDLFVQSWAMVRQMR